MDKGQNVIVVGSDGNVAIGTSRGKVSLVPARSLPSQLKRLIDERQANGVKLTAALTDAKFAVRGSSHTHVVYPAGEPAKPKPPKKK
jgi:hypothetical protein